MRAALQTLSRRQREVVVLHYFLGESVDAIAGELGVPAGTVKSALHRARAASPDLGTSPNRKRRSHRMITDDDLDRMWRDGRRPAAGDLGNPTGVRSRSRPTSVIAGTGAGPRRPARSPPSLRRLSSASPSCAPETGRCESRPPTRPPRPSSRPSCR